MRIWDVYYEQEIMSFEGHSAPVRLALFSPDGRNVVSASDDYTIRIWEFPSLQELIDKTRERFNGRPLTHEEKVLYNME